MADPKPCIGRGCSYPKALPSHYCTWHNLARASKTAQKASAERRLAEAPEPHRSRVKPEEWPPGTRWCSGCQTFVPLFYTSGSRCKSCASEAAHAARVEKVYGITGAEYDQLLRFQGGVCFICRRHVHTKRMAVDHDHETGAVRGLLCPDDERGCNRAVVGSLEGSAHGGERTLDLARRLVQYLEDPPYDRMMRRDSEPLPSVPMPPEWPPADW